MILINFQLLDLDEDDFTNDHTSNYRFRFKNVFQKQVSYFTLEAGDLISFGTTGKGTDKFPRGHKSLLIGEQKG